MAELGRRRGSYEMKGEKRLAHVHALFARVRGYACSPVYPMYINAFYLRPTFGARLTVGREGRRCGAIKRQSQASNFQVIRSRDTGKMFRSPIVPRPRAPRLSIAGPSPRANSQDVPRNNYKSSLARSRISLALGIAPSSSVSPAGRKYKPRWDIEVDSMPR